jgi:hypothetical protein
MLDFCRCDDLVRHCEEFLLSVAPFRSFSCFTLLGLVTRIRRKKNETANEHPWSHPKFGRDCVTPSAGAHINHAL